MAPVLEVRDLAVEFRRRDGAVRAVDGVSLTLDAGEILGLVGESGSGKSVTGLAILGLVDPPGCVVQGSIRLEGREMVGLPDAELRRIRGKRLSMIFQDPMTTLNPVLRIDTQMTEAIRAHERVSSRAARSRAVDLLSRVGIASARERLESYPHQFSGGMRQRVAIAISLLNAPTVLVADEPTTALDVTIQAQILAEVQSLCAEIGTAIIWITHDLSVVAGLADRLAVMYAGRVVEHGTVADVLERPAHPYTAGLIASVPSRNRRGRPLPQIRGTAPSSLRSVQGCAFAPRCDHADDNCRMRSPDAFEIGSRGWRCHRPLGSHRRTDLAQAAP